MKTADDTEAGGDDLSVEQAASAFVKANQTGTGDGQPGAEEADQGEQADDELQASDEDVSEDDGEPEADDQAEEEDGEEPDSNGGRFVASNGKVKLPDGTVSTVAELIQGNLKDRDYRQKTTQVSEERRALEQRSSAVQASEQQVNQQREYLSQMLQALTPQPPDPSLLNEDPIAFMTQKENYERMVGHLNYVQQQSQLSRQQAERQAAIQRNEKSAKEWEILQEKVPELRDQAKAQAVFGDIQSAGLAAGFSPEELAGTVPYDHRMVLVLRKAAKWDKLQTNKPKAVQQVQGRPPVQKSGKRLTPAAQKARQSQDAINRLKQTGSVEDAAAAFLASRKG